MLFLTPLLAASKPGDLPPALTQNNQSKVNWAALGWTSTPSSQTQPACHSEAPPPGL